MLSRKRLSGLILALSVLGIIGYGSTAFAAPHPPGPSGNGNVTPSESDKVAYAIDMLITQRAAYFRGTTSHAAPSLDVDATARAVKESFDANKLTVVGSTATASKVTPTKVDGKISATFDITYTWSLRDTSGITTEASATDTYRFDFDPATSTVTHGSIQPVPQTDELQPDVPTEAKPASTDRSGADKDPTERNTTNPSAFQDRATTVSTSRMGNLDQVKMVNYALLWTDSAHTDKMNSSYPVFRNNCANFVSQSLHTGGWAYRQGWRPSTLTNWSPDLTGPAGPSYTWGGAKHLGIFVWNTAKLPYLDNIWNARYGDIYFMDWDPNGKADGSIDHAALVTGRNNAGPLVTQKSNNRRNVPLATYLAIARSQSKTKIIWYGART